MFFKHICSLTTLNDNNRIKGINLLSIQQNSTIKPYSLINNGCNQSKQNTLQKDTVSFSGKKLTPLDKDYKMGFMEKCKRQISSWRGYGFYSQDEIEAKIGHALDRKGLDPALKPKIYFDTWTSKIELDSYDNSIKLSHFNIESDKDIEKTADAIVSIVKTNEKLQGKMDAIAEESIKILGLEDKFTPMVTLFYEPSGVFGSYDGMGHKVVLNAYWLEKAVQPELIVAEIILHELSHAKTNLNTSLIDTSDLLNELQKTPELLEKVQNDENFDTRRDMVALLGAGSKCPLIGSPEYDRIMWQLVQNIKDDYNPDRGQLTGSKTRDKFNKMKENIAKICNIDPRELFGIDFKALAEAGEVKHKGSTVNALYVEDHQKRIREAVEANKTEVIDILKSNDSLREKFKQKYKGYADIYDEALARYTAASGILKMIESGIIEDNKHTREFALENINDLQMLILKTDPEVKELINSGKINLDSKLLEGLKED